MSDDAEAAMPQRKLRKFTSEQRAQMVAESFVAGASVTAVARRQGVRPNLLSYWRMLSRTTGQTTKGVPGRRAARLAAVQVTAAMPVAREGVIEIDLARGCVRVVGRVDGTMLREVLAATR
jgi:transposase